MLTGELRSKIDAVWNAFWTGGISNPLEVIEQITYLLFVRGLDDEQLLAERKVARFGGAMDGGVYPEAMTAAGGPIAICAGACSRRGRPLRCSPSSPSMSSRSCARWGRPAPAMPSI